MAVKAGNARVSVGAVDWAAVRAEVAQGYPGSELDCILCEIHSLPGFTSWAYAPCLVTARRPLPLPGPTPHQCQHMNDKHNYELRQAV